MWPLCFFLNKFLKFEDGEQDKSKEQGDFTASNHSQDDGHYPDASSSSSYVEVPHIKQLDSWDCGLACVLMVLRLFGFSSCNIHELANICSTNSIWTVDLAYLLQSFCIDFSYFTITFGANPNYSIEAYYKEQIHDDVERVDSLFRKAHEVGINIQCRSVSIHEISRLILSGNYIVIALVDQFKLSMSWFEEVIVSGVNGDNSSYTGHYILICGYDAATDEFEIRDPASSMKRETISSQRMENARKSYGTDEDLLLISLKNIKQH